MNIAAHVPKNSRRNVLQSAHETARTMQSSFDRNDVLAALATRLAEVGGKDEALAVIREIPAGPTEGSVVEDERVRVALQLAMLGWQSEALEVIALVWDPSRHSHLLAKLAPCLSLSGLQNAFNTARRLRDTGGDKALAALAVRCAELGDHDTALTEARAIEDQYWRVKALLNILPYLEEPKRPDVLQEAHNLAHKMKGNWAKADSLASVVQFLDEPDRKETVNAIEAAAYAAVSEGTFPGKWITILGQEKKKALLRKTLSDALSDKPAFSLKAILPYLSRPLLDVAEKKVLHGIRKL